MFLLVLVEFFRQARIRYESLVTDKKGTPPMLSVKTRKPKTHIRKSFGDRGFLTFVYIALGATLLVVLYPMVYVFSASLSSPLAVTSGKVWLYPVNFTLHGYEVMLSDPQIVTGYVNSIYYAFFGTIISVALTIAVAYPLSRKKLYGRSLLLFLITFTMIFSGGLSPPFWWSKI